MKTKPQLSFCQNLEHELWLPRNPVWLCLTGGFMSSIFVSLGASKDEIPLLWIAAPLAVLLCSL